MAFLLSLEGIQRRDLDTGAKLFAALSQPALMHGARPARHQVHSSGPWDDPSHEWSTMPVSSRGPRRRRSWWCHTYSSNPIPEPLRNGRGSDAACRHSLIWDHTVFHVVASCRANPAMVAPSKRNCRIASGSPAHPNAPWVRLPSRCAPGMSPSGRVKSCGVV